MPNVLMIDSERGWGGGQAQVELLAKGLLERGVGVSLVVPPGSTMEKRARSIGVPVSAMGMAGDLDISCILRLRKLIKRGGFDVVHSHSAHAHGIASLAALGLRNPPRLVVSRRVGFPRKKGWLSRLKYVKGADGYIAISRAAMEELVAGGVSPGRVEIIPSGIDPGRFIALRDAGEVRGEFGFPADCILVGTVGRLAANKAQDDFIRAAGIISKAQPAARFLVVGEGPKRSELERLIRDLRLEGVVVLTGFREDVPSLIAAMDCFVISSIVEGLCTSIMDAQAIGVPVVATRAGGIVDLVEDGLTGRLVAPRSPDVLAEAVEQMLKDESLRKRCVEAARKNARDYDYNSMVERTIAFYRKTLSAQGARNRL
jgi:glycosyltransferase involved in cell wall biosynthesis